MNIIGVQYNINQNAIEIYFSGCIGNPHCKGCFSPETWEFNQGTFYKNKIQDIAKQIEQFNDMIEKIMIFGGEPLDQNIEELTDFLKEINKYDKEMWIFTHYDFDEAKNILGDTIYLCDYIKCGAYVEELKTDDNIQYGVKLATSNQHIYKKLSNNEWQ